MVESRVFEGVCINLLLILYLILYIIFKCNFTGYMYIKGVDMRRVQ